MTDLHSPDQADNADFSFAGIKTAVRRAIEAEAPGPATEANLQVPSAGAVWVFRHGIMAPVWPAMQTGFL